MAIHKSDAAKGKHNIAYPGFAGQAVTFRYAMAVPTTVQADDILELAPIPPNCRVAEIVLDSNDLDSHGTPTLALDVGIMSGGWGEDGARTVGAEFFAASEIGRTGGVARPTLATAYRTGTADHTRSIGVKIGAAAATAAAGQIGLTVTVVAQ